MKTQMKDPNGYEKSNPPNKTQRKFILNILIPAILREQGRRFIMDTWKDTITPEMIGEYYDFDGIDSIVTKKDCGTVCCIGGTMEVLTRKRGFSSLSKHIGLTEYEADALFSNWQNFYPGELSWPAKYMSYFSKAKT